MTIYSVTRKHLSNGIWTGTVTTTQKPATEPNLRVMHLGKPIPGLTVTEGEATHEWNLTIPIPLTAISDGVQVFLILDADTEEQLDSFTLISGEGLQDDIRAEVELLRAELDMLKRAFRRHCLETD